MPDLQPGRPAQERPEVKLDPALQARILEQMREEQAAAIRARTVRNWVLLPAAVLCLVIGTVLMFSDDLAVSFLANTVATGIVIVLWRLNRDWIRDTFGV